MRWVSDILWSKTSHKSTLHRNNPFWLDFHILHSYLNFDPSIIAKGTMDPRHWVLWHIQQLQFKVKASTSFEILVKLKLGFVWQSARNTSINTNLCNNCNKSGTVQSNDWTWVQKKWKKFTNCLFQMNFHERLHLACSAFSKVLGNCGRNSKYYLTTTLASWELGS